MGILLLVGAVFFELIAVLLKLSGAICASWWWVLSPIWVSVLLAVLVIVVDLFVIEREWE